LEAESVFFGLGAPSIVMAEEEPKLVYSEHCGHYLVDGESLEVLIYKGDDEQGWTLEVVNQHGTSTVWDDPFISDGLAWRAFTQAAEEEGVKEFFAEDEPFGRLH